MAASATSLLVHPSALYVGLAGDAPVRRAGDAHRDRRDRSSTSTARPSPARTIDGAGRAPATGRTSTASTSNSRSRRRRTATVTSRRRAGDCTFATPDGGTYQITAPVADDHGRPNQTEITRLGDRRRRPAAARRRAASRSSSSPTPKEYQPGDTAEILVAGAVLPGRGRCSPCAARRHGVDPALHDDRPDHDARGADRRGHVPNVHVQVDLVGAAPRLDDDGQPIDGAAQAPGLRPRPAQPGGAAAQRGPSTVRSRRARPRSSRAARPGRRRGEGRRRAARCADAERGGGGGRRGRCWR